MAKRYILTADIFVDDDGRIGVVLPEAMFQDGRLKVDAAGVTLSVDMLDVDVEAITGAGAGAKSLADLHAALESGLPAYGVDAAGEDSYATVVTAPARVCHYLHAAVGDNGAIISLNGGTNEHFAIPANTERLFCGLAIASGAVIQGKNLSAGNNYTNLRISVW